MRLLGWAAMHAALWVARRRAMRVLRADDGRGRA